MPAKNKTPSNTGSRKPKRKTISPILEDSTRKSSSAGTVENEHADKRSKQTNTQVDTGQYNPSQSIVTDFGGHWPYMAFSQPYPGYGPSPPPPHSPFGFGPMMQPPWATEILSEIKYIKDKMKSIDRIEQTINSIAAKVSDLETKVKDIDCRVQHTETCAQFLGSKLDENSVGLSNVSSKIKQLNKSCTHLEEQYRTLEALEKKNTGRNKAGFRISPSH